MHRRHDLLWPDAEGRRAALATARPLLAGATREQVEALIGNPVIPAIVSRQEERHDGQLEAGFSSPEKYDGSRLRVAVLVPLDRVVKTATPFQVADWVTSVGEPLRQSILIELVEAAKKHDLTMGFFGSTALQAMTGLPYCDAGSDIDGYVKVAGSAPALSGFYRVVMELESESGIRIDIECEYEDVFGIKLKELFAGQKMVLAKGLHSAELFPAATVRAAFRI